MSKPSAKTKKPPPSPRPPPPPPPRTHIVLLIADAHKIARLLGEVPCKYGTAWVIEVLQKAPQGTIDATAPFEPPTPDTPLAESA